jgi:hypothetical protein
MTNNCSSCKLTDDCESMDQLIMCKGCGQCFHTFCAGVASIVFQALENCENLSWKCDKCSENGFAGDATKLIMEKLNAMSADIETLKMKNAPRKPFSELLTPKNARFEVKTPGSKRKRVDNAIPTPTIAHGTGAACSELMAVKPLKWLYVTMLHPTTTGEAVANQLSKALNAQATDFNCVKLLAKEVQSPTYISFKIGMNDDLFAKSMEPSVWPPGVAFREFVNRPRRLFRPVGVQLQ